MARAVGGGGVRKDDIGGGGGGGSIDAECDGGHSKDGVDEGMASVDAIQFKPFLLFLFCCVCCLEVTSNDGRVCTSGCTKVTNDSVASADEGGANKWCKVFDSCKGT
jgi:hypothetical protein